MKKHLLLAYATNRGLNMMTEADAKRLTHVNLAFGVLKGGLLDMHGLPDIARVKTLKAWNPSLKFVLSVGGWGAGGFSNMSMTDADRRAFARSVRDALDANRLDGVDIDWEYPCNDAANIDADPRDKENFTHLLQALRDAVGDKIVSIAAGAGAYFVRDTEMDKVAAICDYVQIMTYDMRSGFCKQAGHHTALYASRGDADDISADASLKMFHEAGVPKEKLVMGAAFYCRRWEGVESANHGLLQTASSIGMGGPDYSKLLSDYIGKDGWHEEWDEDAQAPYLWKDGQFISYDNPRSLRAKCEYLKREGLLGIMYWEHSCDHTHTLLETLADALSND